MKHWSMLLLVFLVAGAARAVPPAARFPAFPGAEGAGAYTPGGRGGKVFLVTTLEDYLPGKERPIPGSLRAAVAAKGPRTVVFRVGGTIALKDHLEIEEPFITIAGQSAPGGGICLKNWSLQVSTHDVVVRYLRVRPGDVSRKEMDGISCNGQNVIFDHCSVSWAIDETLSTNGASENVTVQWCMITESLNESVHHKGSHGYGSLISGPGEMTFHHNLYAFHRSRNPRPGPGRLEFRNNLIYGWGDRAGYSGNDRAEINYVGNFLKPLNYSKDKQYAYSPGGPRPRVYLAGNVFDGFAAGTRDNLLLLRPAEGMTAADVARVQRVPHPFPTATVTTESAAAAHRRVLDEAGARLPERDAVDARVVALIRAGKGRIINSQEGVGGWPALSSGSAPPDTDGDGMPDAWEQRHGLNPADVADTNEDADGDGFTNLEECLNGTDPRSRFAWIAPPAVTTDRGRAFVGEARVTMASTTPGVEIRYTLDGSEPTRQSMPYTEPFPLERSATVRGKAFLSGQESHVTNAILQNLRWSEAANPGPVASGLRYTYYEAGDWRGFPEFDTLKPVKSGAVEAISMAPAQVEGGFGFRWTGFVRVPRDGIYTFWVRSSVLSQFHVAGTMLVETQSRRRVRSGEVALKAGLQPIMVQVYLHPTADRTLEIEWAGPGMERQPLPAAALFRPAGE